MIRIAHPGRAARGSTTVEFALGAVIFFGFIFGVVELSRAMYLNSTLVEVTRRAARMAAHTDLSDQAKMDALRVRAMFGSAGVPMAGPGLGPANLNIDYLDSNMARVATQCPAQNIVNCSLDPSGPTCIRFVRVRVCRSSTGADCEPVDYVPMAGTNMFPNLMRYPTYATMTPIGTLGHEPGVISNCN